MWKKFQKLGDGSQGSVYLAVNDNSFQVAVKTATLEYARSLQRETQFLKKFKGHPYVVECYGEDISLDENHNGYVYNLLMEVAAGGALDDLIDKYNDVMPESHAACYTYMLLKGLSHIHGHGVIHCDIKPQNILVFPTKNRFGLLGHLKIADFGLSKTEDEKKVVTGTSYYASPESFLYGVQGKAADIWSLGVTVLRMMHGRQVWNRLEDIWEPEIPEYVSETGKDFLKKCFEEKVGSRWSADQLLNHPFINNNKISGMLPPPGFEFRHMQQDNYSSNPFKGSWSVTQGKCSSFPERAIQQPDRCYQLFPEGNDLCQLIQ